MMTPQEVAKCTFTKTVMGGYNMTAVDDFLDRLTEDYTTLYKDNAALKAKLKVLVDKMEEYRQMEDAMRSTLLTAQKMATTIVSEAESKRDAIIADAAGGAKDWLEEIRQEVEREEQRLQQVRADVEDQIQAEQLRLKTAQEELRGFIAGVQDVCTQQLQLLERLPQLPAAPAAAAEPVQPPQAPVSPEQEELAQQIDAALQDDLSDVFAAIEREAPPAQSQPQEDLADIFAAELARDEAEADMASTRKINLDQLQFGKNYIKD